MGSPKLLTLLVSCCIFLILRLEHSSASLVEEIKNKTHVLKAGAAEISINENHDFQMFCRIGDRKHFIYYFRTATLRIVSSADDIRLMKGHNPKDVYMQYTQSTKWYLWIANVLPWRVRDTTFPTFNTSCVGISTGRPYSALHIVRPIDPWRVLILIAGIGVYLSATRLSKSKLFFYSSGTFLGAVAAALVFLFIFTRVLPKSRIGYLSLSALWTLALYFAGETWKHMEELVHERLPYIVMYLTSGALIAFLACYRWGPPVHPRTIDIIRWALKAVGCLLIHYSSDLVEMSTAMILMVIIWDNASPYIKYQLERYIRRMFPPKPRLLTEEEYITQASIETQKSLENLRSFCSSPESKPWKLVTRLKDPRRFSSFVEGGSHLSDDEVLAYESEDDENYAYSRAILPAAPVSPAAYPPLNELLTDDDDSFNLLETDDEN